MVHNSPIGINERAKQAPNTHPPWGEGDPAQKNFGLQGDSTRQQWATMPRTLPCCKNPKPKMASPPPLLPSSLPPSFLPQWCGSPFDKKCPNRHELKDKTGPQHPPWGPKHPQCSVFRPNRVTNSCWRLGAAKQCPARVATRAPLAPNAATQRKTAALGKPALLAKRARLGPRTNSLPAPAARRRVARVKAVPWA